MGYDFSQFSGSNAQAETHPTGPGAWTGFFVPEWGKLFVSARREGEHSAEILVYETR